MKKILWSASFVLVLFALTFAVAHAEDEKGEKKSDKPTLASFPEAVQKALKKQAGDNTIDKVEIKGKGDKAQYVAEWKTGDLGHEAYVSADGTLLKTEDEVASKDVPEKVQKAAKEALTGASEIEYIKIHIVKGDKTFYEAASGKKSFFCDAEGGKVKASDADEDDDEGEEDDDDDASND